MPTALSRRSFLSAWNPIAGARPTRLTRPLSTGLDPFVPSLSQPWDAYAAGHLLRRTMMMPTWADIQTLVALNDPGKAVDLLLSTTDSPTTPSAGNDATENPYPLALPVQTQIEGQWVGDAAALRQWWLNLHLAAQTSIAEKMTFFWSCHFTTQFDLGGENYTIAPLLYRQNELFRSNALGNFQDLVKAVTLDGAMLVFLGGNTSTGSAPNENYARELMELFTCGLDHYSQGDVENGAKILSGWRIAQYTDDPAPNQIFNAYFSPADHDIGSKTYLGQVFDAIGVSGNSQDQVKKNEIDRMIDVLFEVNGSFIANFIATKLYKFFVYSNAAAVDQTVISAMADLFIQNNFEIAPVVSALLKSAHFFDNANIGAQIKTPAEYVIGMARQILPARLQATIATTVDAWMTADDQEFFQPPNVSGWPGYHDWITTTTYPLRGDQADSSGSKGAIQLLTPADALAFVQQFPNYTDVNALTTAIGQLLLPRPLSAGRQQTFAQTLAGTTQTYEWPQILSNSPATAENNILKLLQYIVALPDFQLC